MAQYLRKKAEERIKGAEGLDPYKDPHTVSKLFGEVQGLKKAAQTSLQELQRYIDQENENA